MNKRMYVVKDSTKTYAYFADQVRRAEVDHPTEREETIDETTEEIKQVPTKMLLNTEENIALYFQNKGKWVDVEFVDEVLGKHDAKVQRLLAKPKKEDEEEYKQLHVNLKQAYINENRPSRLDAVIASVVCTKYDGEENITEEFIEDLPLSIKSLIVATALDMFPTNGLPDFFPSA